MTALKKLFEPIKVGRVDLKNRLVMAPVTAKVVPTDREASIVTAPVKVSPAFSAQISPASPAVNPRVARAVASFASSNSVSM